MKMKKVLAAVFALTAAAANFGTAAFAEEEVIVTEPAVLEESAEVTAAEEVVMTESVTLEETEEAAVAEETAEESTAATEADETTDVTEAAETEESTEAEEAADAEETEEPTEDTEKTEVTEQTLLDKFTAEYGDPESIVFDDFNGDGQLEAYMNIYKDKTVFVYYVTADSVAFVRETPMIESTNGSIEKYLYFSLEDGTRFLATVYHHSSELFTTASLSINKIEPDGSLSKTLINGREYIDVFADVLMGIIGGSDVEYTNDMTFEQSCDPATYISSSGNSVTIKYFDYDDGLAFTDGLGKGSYKYSYDKAKNAFVTYSPDAENKDEENNSGENSGTSGGSTAVSSSPETGDSMDIPAVMAATLIVGTAVAVSTKKKKNI
ncbi:MAG: LPXTG cell wall anchor domain-containing protein [Ruminococcus sp.]